MRDRLTLLEGDITKLDVEALVNAANTSLVGGGGVDGAIHRAAGPKLQSECLTLGGCITGQAKMTAGYKLKARWVIHTVGPVWNGGKSGEPRMLASCYRQSLALAVEHKIRSLAFPAISCGAYGYPVEEACSIGVGETIMFLQGNRSLERVIFCAVEKDVYAAYERALSAVV